MLEKHGSRLRCEIHVIKTSGDKIQDRALLLAGGKGLFTKELEEALLAETIDVAVHSMKDMPSILPRGLGIIALLPREDVRDALITLDGRTLNDLPEGATIGTASIRRESFLRNRRPDLKIVLFRGNVQTRLRKLADGEADATLLAAAGLKRLGLQDRISQTFEVEDMLPAPAQGAIGIEARLADKVTRDLVLAVHDEATGVEIDAERAFLGELDGSCRTPIAALARFDGERVTFRGMLLTPDGARTYETAREGTRLDAARMGLDAARELYRRGGADVFRNVA
jgi:hydroxymethylbilane synthase